MTSATDLPDFERLGRAQCLSLAYARTATRADISALMLLDAQFAGFVRDASEPFLGQMRLAWWRDRFMQAPADWPKGNPLLAQFATWGAESSELRKMVDGWEILLGERPLDASDIGAHAQSRAQGWVALARNHGFEQSAAPVAAAAERWLLVDFAWNGAKEGEHILALKLASAVQSHERIPRALRPLSVLDGLAQRALVKSRPPLSRASDMLRALRSGLLGR